VKTDAVVWRQSLAVLIEGIVPWDLCSRPGSVPSPQSAGNSVNVDRCGVGVIVMNSRDNRRRLHAAFPYRETEQITVFGFWRLNPADSALGKPACSLSIEAQSLLSPMFVTRLEPR